MKASDLKGRAVVTLSDAAKVGQIDDILFDAEYRTVLGFRVKGGGLFSGTEALPRDRVSSIGADALTVDSPDAINAEDRFPGLTGASTLTQARGTKVVTEGGDLLGTVDGLELDDDARTVTSYTLAAPLLDRLRHREPTIDAHHVTRIGEGGLMIVANDAAESVRSDGE